MAALLIVDDYPIIRDTLCRLFADKYECDTADRAEQALELVEIHEYAAIITDSSMPGADGAQVLKRIQARALPIPVIVISASGDQFKDLFLEMGAFAYFSNRLGSRNLSQQLHAPSLPYATRKGPDN
jgi:two-component system OmpR family response regulator